MKTIERSRRFGFYLLLMLLSIDIASYAQSVDPRNIKSGLTIPDESYSDQPYVLKTDDGAWLCVLTTAKGHEGVSGQHVIAQRSLDQGKTWIDQVDIEPANGPEASYAVLAKAPGGRIFVFYNHNSDNVRSVIGDNPPYKNGEVRRVDSQGYFVYKYSDDQGKSWSSNRYPIPVRAFNIDQKNPYRGKIRFFWNVGRAFNYKGAVYVPLIKVGGFGEGFFTSSEGVLLRSEDLFTVKDPAKAHWTTLPDGEIGLRTPLGEGGPIAEEQSYTVLSDGSFFCVYRTIDGFAACAYSRDGGHTWEPSQYMRYDNGRLMKHPRAANFVWKCENGKYLYWFHNHGGRFIREHPNRRNMAYNDRNPVWIAGGVEKDGPHGKVIRWTQPEILFYDDDPMVRISYPDLLEEKNSYYITETQKDLARVHKIDSKLFEGLWAQFDTEIKSNKGVLVSWKSSGASVPTSVKSPPLPELYKRNQTVVDQAGLSMENGFSLDVSFRVAELKAGDVLLDNRDAAQIGWVIRVNEQRALELLMNDGQTEALWACDPGMLQLNRDHYMSIIVDGGPKIISFVVDGILNDGGDHRQFGWGRFSPYLKTASGASEVKVAPAFSGQVKAFTLYNRAISVSEAISNYRAEIQGR